MDHKLSKQLKSKITIALLAAAFLAGGMVLPSPMPVSKAFAIGACPGQKNGKCPQTKKPTKSRSDYTAEERAKHLEEARKICKAKFGAPSRVHHMDYKKGMVYCTEPGYD